MRNRINLFLFALIFLLPFLRVAASQADGLKGSVAGETYVSPRNLFTVKIPKPINWARVPFVIQEDTQEGRPDYDLVAFYVKDFGEVLIASIRHIPEDVLAKMAKDEHRVVLSNIAYKALYDWRTNFPEEPVVSSENYFKTSYGEAILRVYRAKNGSLLQKIQGGPDPKPEPFDILIAVLLAKSGNKQIYAIAENDYLTEGGKNKDKLEEIIREFFLGIEVKE